MIRPNDRGVGKRQTFQVGALPKGGAGGFATPITRAGMVPSKRTKPMGLFAFAENSLAGVCRRSRPLERGPGRPHG